MKRVPLLTILPALAGLLPGHQANAQIQFPRGQSSVHGFVLDSATNAPVLRGQLCRIFDVGPPTGQAMRCASTDTLGHFAFDSLPAGTHPLRLACYGTNAFNGKRLAQFTVSLEARDTQVVDLRVNAAGCDQRPMVIRHQEFRGFYSYGFEESIFYPLDDRKARIWVECASCGDGTVQWPVIAENSSTDCVYVEWLGIQEGPGVYGHLGWGQHQLTVQRVLTVRAADPKECVPA